MANVEVDLSVPSLFAVKDQVALVTGGGSGIGTMIATALVQNGAKVYISSRKEKQLKEVSEALTKAGPGSCQYFVTDLSVKQGVDALATYIKSKETKLHILFNNSGVIRAGRYDDFPEKEGWDQVMDLNVKSLFYLTAALTPLLVKDSTNITPGRVINIASSAGISPLSESGLSATGTGMYSYYVSKAAAIHLTDVLAAKLISSFVTVNAILPGVFPSKMTELGFRKKKDMLIAGQPTGRTGDTADMAGIALFLCSRAASHITGAHIAVDGGRLLTRL
jgi:NAD(P)-dependent dehydrogenase (short-subunit alcohol dehydrogenase family)